MIRSNRLTYSAPIRQPNGRGPRKYGKRRGIASREKIDDQPGDFPEAQLQILTIVSIDLAHGREAARQATVDAMGEIAMSEDVRAALAQFFERGLTAAGG